LKLALDSSITCSAWLIFQTWCEEIWPKNQTKEKSFTLSPMASNLKLLPVCFGVNMCETTLSHAQYVDDV
jgi:hypothetical protein